MRKRTASSFFGRGSVSAASNDGIRAREAPVLLTGIRAPRRNVSPTRSPRVRSVHGRAIRSACAESFSPQMRCAEPFLCARPFSPRKRYTEPSSAQSRSLCGNAAQNHSSVQDRSLRGSAAQNHSSAQSRPARYYSMLFCSADRRMTLRMPTKKIHICPFSRTAERN